MQRFAIVNGDDFGLSPGINRGIIESYRDGILTSASLMAVGDAFEEAVTLARQHQGLSLGVHLTLIEGRPVLPSEKVPSLVMDNRHFCESLGMFLLRWMTGQIRMTDVEREFAAQIEKALDHGARIDKLDSHMHVHLLPGIFQAVLAVAKRYRIRAIRLPRERIVGRGGYPPIGGLWRRATLASLAAFRRRPLAAAEIFHSTRFCGVAESGHLNEVRFLQLLRGLRSGVTEVMVHPGYRDKIVGNWPMSRRYEREQELNALTSPTVKALVERQEIQLVTYPTVVQRRITL